jgi:putative flippase GtrA
MFKTIKRFLGTYREQILYLIFGGLTTAVDWAISFSLYYVWEGAMQSAPALLHVADILAWVGAVAFAFVTNRIWVFESRVRGFLPIAREVATFAGGRVFTLLLQEAIMAVFVTVMGLNKYLFRILAAILVIVLNYVISKLLVFQKTKKRGVTGDDQEA